MVFDAAGQAYNQDGGVDDGMGRVLLMQALVHNIMAMAPMIKCLGWQIDFMMYKPTRERNPNCAKTPYAVLRYLPITPRLQRLYASQPTAEQIMWHANHQTEEGSMCHMSDAEAWRHFDQTHPDFAVKPCNVRLGLCIDGFALHG
ncbi:UNVERIFIED_CONTAM: hypothetical protein Scaly_1047000 [Sesamum calycinum]|uniref:Uncharacterized protein n=1 Tax=Sesamum calycinum TaxID=2727403 RepID=A0AAW2QKQ6_9LAMI